MCLVDVDIDLINRYLIKFVNKIKVINLMFLSKKPAVNQGKPKQHNNKDKKILGG